MRYRVQWNRSRRLAVVVGLLCALALLVILSGATAQGARDRQDPAPPTIWATLTPIPTPVMPTATPAILPAELTGKGMTGPQDYLPFETCINLWCEEYYNGYNQGGPIGPAVYQRYGSDSIDYYWGLDKPISQVDRADNWAGRFRRRVRIATPGAYNLCIYHDDGIKVNVNNQPIFYDDLWGSIGPGVPYFSYATISNDGNQNLDIEILYFNSGGIAFLKFWWEYQWANTTPCQGPPPGNLTSGRFVATANSWHGEYYNSPNYYAPNPNGWPSVPGFVPVWPSGLYNNLVLVRDDPTNGPDYIGQPGEGLYFDWGLGSPGPGINADGFSVRWSRAVQFAGGFYRFYLRVDDGGVLYVDGNAIINQWRTAAKPQAPTTYTVDIYLPPGSHSLSVEYQEIIGSATVRFWWEQI